MRWLLAGLPLDPFDPLPREVAETAPDLAGNAVLKALAYSEHGLAIASDGGLDVPALTGEWNPVRTQRQGQAWLRRHVAGLQDRRVGWREAVAIASHGELLASWEEAGTAGVLAREPWPDPTELWVWDIFTFPALGKSWAQLSVEERAQVDLTWTRLKARVQRYFATNPAGDTYS